jgi:hypothetical protein
MLNILNFLPIHRTRLVFFGMCSVYWFDLKAGMPVFQQVHLSMKIKAKKKLSQWNLANKICCCKWGFKLNPLIWYNQHLVDFNGLNIFFKCVGLGEETLESLSFKQEWSFWFLRTGIAFRRIFPPRLFWYSIN